MANNDMKVKLLKRMLAHNIQLDPHIFDFLDLNRDQDELTDFLLDIANKYKVKGKFFNVITLDMIKNELSKNNSDKKITFFKFTKVKDFLIELEKHNTQTIYAEMLKDRIRKSINIFKSRLDFKDVVSIANLKRSFDTINILRICGLVLNKQFKKNEVTFMVEDLSDHIEIHVPYDVYYRCGEVLLDECILIELRKNNDSFVCIKFYHPDVGDLIDNNCKDDAYVVFLSGLGIGQENFDNDSWEKLVSWLNGTLGDKEIVDNIRLLVIVGDIVDVSGFSNLEMSDAYENVFHLLQRIPPTIKIIVLPGEKDASSYFLPQIPIIRSFSKSLHSLKNVQLESNPSYFQVNEAKVLVFHGQSLDDVRRQIRNNDSATAAMIMLLKARHLAPSVNLLYNLYPSTNDVLFIDEVPNIFVCGHLSQKEVNYYKGILLVSLPSWNKNLDVFGGRCAVVNLRTLEVLWR